MAEELITIGEITRHQGNKGEVRVKPLTDFPERFRPGTKVLLTAGRQQKEVEIESAWSHKGFIILKFVEFDNIEQAIDHKGYTVKVAPGEAVELPPDSYFMDQILGLEVYTTEEDYLGQVEEIIETGAHDIYRVGQGEAEVLIPAVKEMVTEVEIEAGRMTVNLVAGLR